MARGATERIQQRISTGSHSVADAREKYFQQDILNALADEGWLVGKAAAV